MLIITISAGISGTYQALCALFADYTNVLVYDSQLAVGGIRFLVEEAVRWKNEQLEFVKEKLDALVPRISIMAIPATLDYLLAGGRLTKTSWMAGMVLGIRPIIGFKDGKVTVLAKKRGLKQGMNAIIEAVKKTGYDQKYGIIASYTNEKENVETLIKLSDASIQSQIKIYDNLTPSIACHWGPGAFGFIYVKNEFVDEYGL